MSRFAVLALLTMALTSTGVSAASGGFSITMSDKGINYVLKTITPVLENELKKIDIPQIIGKVRQCSRRSACGAWIAPGDATALPWSP